MDNGYLKQVVEILYETGVADEIIKSKGKKNLDFDMKYLGTVFSRGKHSGLDSRSRKLSGNYFKFFVDYLKTITLKSFESYKISEGRINFSGKNVTMDGEAIEAFVLGWNHPDVTKYHEQVKF